MKRNSMKRLLALVLCSLLIAGSIGITAMAESDDTYLYVGGVKVTEANANDILDDGIVSFDFATSTLTFTAEPTFSDYHNGALIDTDMEKLTIVTPTNGLSIWDWDEMATTIIHMSDGALTVNGKLDLGMISEDSEAFIQVKKGLTVTGDVLIYSLGAEYSYGILSEDGPVTINGSIETSGDMEYGICANGPVEVTGSVRINDSRYGIVSTSGGIVCGSDAEINVVTVAMKSTGLDSGITVNGDVTVENKGGKSIGVLEATDGPISIDGDLNVINGYSECVISSKDDITVGGNADIHVMTYNVDTQKNKAMRSTAGSIAIGGYLRVTNASNSPVYAYDSINVTGDATVGGSIHYKQDYIMKAENGSLTVGGKLTTTGVAQNVVYGKTGVTVDGNVAINAAYKEGMDPTGCYAMNAPDGSVTVNGTVDITANPEYGYEGACSGAEFGVYAGDQIHIAEKWDVTAGTVALRAVNGIVKPDNFGVTLPENGAIVALTDGTTVTESDRTTVAAHAVIDEVEAITITLDPRNGDAPTTVTIAVGGTLSELPTDITREWYKLIGWFMDSRTGLETGTGTQVTLETVFNEDTTIYANWYMPGDVNGDDKVNNKDNNRLLRYLAGDDVEVVLFACDVNGDGKINNKDNNRLLRYLAGDDVEIF